MSNTKEPETPAINIRSPNTKDAREIWQLVCETGVLDKNSAYLYLLLCRDFTSTCLVAKRGARLVGFVSAYRPPTRPHVLFVWQIGVCASVRRQGVGRRMLAELFSRCAPGSLSFIETTVSPSNEGSLRLFETFARELNAPLVEVEGAGFSAGDFPPGDHEPEPLLRIGPLDTKII